MKSPITTFIVSSLIFCGVSTLASAEMTVTPSNPTETISTASTTTIPTTVAAKSKVYFIEPAEGQQVAQTFTVKFGLSGMGVAPAGIEKDKTGHHHLLIDVDTLPPMDQPLPATDHIKHYGGGQTETQITLTPGKHTLQLVLGNHLHVPIGSGLVSEKITVEVK